jgi:hypothetical protein
MEIAIAGLSVTAVALITVYILSKLDKQGKRSQ